MRDDLVKLKCEYFDSVVKTIKTLLEYDSNKDSFSIKAVYDSNYTMPELCDFFIVKDKKKYKLTTYKIVSEDDMVIDYRFSKKENVGLEDGIYYKGIKVSEL